MSLLVSPRLRLLLALPSVVALVGGPSSAAVAGVAEPVRIAIASVFGRPGDLVSITVSLAISGEDVGATANDIAFDPEALSIEPSGCRLLAATEHALHANPLAAGSLRVFVQPTAAGASLAGGALYRCSVQIRPTALPATYPLLISNALAFDPAASRSARSKAATAPSPSRSWSAPAPAIVTAIASSPRRSWSPECASLSAN